MKNAGVLAKSDKELKAKTAQLAKRKIKETVEIQKVEEGDLRPADLFRRLPKVRARRETDPKVSPTN